MDIVARLSDLLKDIPNIRITFDPGRDNTYPCNFCAVPATPRHKLVAIGRYPNGDAITRPVCEKCLLMVEEMNTKIIRTQEETWKFTDDIINNYLFFPLGEVEPVRPTLSPFALSDPERLRQCADEIEQFEKDLKIFKQKKEENKEQNDQIIKRFIDDTFKFLNIERHPKKKNIIDYCNKRISIQMDRHTTDYLRSIFYEIFYLLEEGLI